MEESTELELVFEQDGEDLIVSTTVEANNSPHVLWTHVMVTSTGRVMQSDGRLAEARTMIWLEYCVIQNRDLIVRSLKDVKITWRVPGRKKDDSIFKAHEIFTPTSAELNDLLPELQALMEKGENRSMRNRFLE